MNKTTCCKFCCRYNTDCKHDTDSMRCDRWKVGDCPSAPYCNNCPEFKEKEK